jgi:hypothetical protein
MQFDSVVTTKTRCARKASGSEVAGRLPSALLSTSTRSCGRIMYRTFSARFRIQGVFAGAIRASGPGPRAITPSG